MPVNNSRIAVLPYGPSDSATALVNLLRERGNASTKLRVEHSLFRARRGDLVVNWGNSSIQDQAWGRLLNRLGNSINQPTDLSNASNKLKAFQKMAQDGVSLVEWTLDAGVAQGWVDGGNLVYARTKLQGHSGEGIVAVHNNPETIQGAGAAFPVGRQLPRASLYTKGITAQRREFRIHVFAGEVVYVQQKKRTNDYQNNPNYSNVVRNYHTGWIYATNEIRPNDASVAAAKASVASLGLDFGAVDVITRGEDAWVLEVNTAPGLQGTTLEVYADAIENFHNGRPQIRYDQRARNAPVAPAQVEEDEEPAPVPLVAAMAQAAPAPVGVAQRPQPVRPQAARAGALEDGKFYFATVNETRCVVQYNQGMDSFFMTGWDIAIPRAEVADLRIAVEG